MFLPHSKIRSEPNHGEISHLPAPPDRTRHLGIMAGKPEIIYTDSNVETEPTKSEISRRGDVNDSDQLLKLGKKPVLKVRPLRRKGRGDFA